MGILSWLRNLIGDRPPRKRVRRFSASCLYCGAPINSAQQRKCEKCGKSWGGVKRREPPPRRAKVESSPQAAQPETKRTSSRVARAPLTRAQLELGTFAAPEIPADREPGPVNKSARQAGRSQRRPPRAKQTVAAPAEEEERTQQRKEETARRRASDIIFLGQGVSSQLGNRESDLAELARRNIPQFSTPSEIATALGIAIPRLRWLAFHDVCSSTSHYVSFTVPKRSGGARMLAAPHRELARCQKWIETEILNKLFVHSAAHGFVRGRSIVTNAAPHVSRGLVVNLDLREFFPTITFPRVRGLFKKLGYSPAAATVLALLCTECPRVRAEIEGETHHVAAGERSLPQGACTSPALSNLIAYRLDCRLDGFAHKHGWTYTRYADDLTFSADGPGQSPRGLIAAVRHLVGAEGFELNPAKTRVLRQSARQQITGVVVNDRPGAPRELLRRLRAILHQARHEGLNAQNRGRHRDFSAWLKGQIAYVSMINPDQGRKLKEAFSRIDKVPHP